MIPSDHFVYFYNEIFKELEKLGPEALDKYYARVADRQAYFTLEAFKRDGLKGMYDYWERIRIEENCQMETELTDDHYRLRMTRRWRTSLSWRQKKHKIHYRWVLVWVDGLLFSLVYYQTVMKKQVTVAEIGARIRAIRKTQGVSQETLAGLAGTGQRYISELERGKTTARLGEMLKVLNALGAGLYILSQDELVEWNR